MLIFTSIAWLIVPAWVFQALLSSIQAHRLAHLIRRKRRAGFDAYQPFAAVIVPFKGIDEGLEQAIRSLATQEYKDYRLILVVDSQDDPAFEVLTEQAKQYPERRIDILISGPASPNESQKIHNQLFAIDTLTEDDVVWVFADSDAVPGRMWLLDMVGPLGQDKTGITTGYRWLIPTGSESTGRPTLPSILASVMNSSTACMYREKQFSLAWGGSMAVRADTAKAGDLVGHLRGALTDDYQLTRMCRKLNRRVYFVRKAIAPTPVDFTWRSMINFARRQYLITRIYMPLVYFAALMTLSLYWAGLFIALGAFIHGVLFNGHILAWLPPLSALIAVGVFNQIRASMRRRVIRRAFGHDMLPRMRATLWWDRFGTPVWMILHYLLVLSVMFKRTMNWRGIRYKLRGPQDIERLSE